MSDARVVRSCQPNCSGGEFLGVELRGVTRFQKAVAQVPAGGPLTRDEDNERREIRGLLKRDFHTYARNGTTLGAARPSVTMTVRCRAHCSKARRFSSR